MENDKETVGMTLDRLSLLLKLAVPKEALVRAGRRLSREIIMDMQKKAESVGLPMEGFELGIAEAAGLIAGRSDHPLPMLKAFNDTYEDARRDAVEFDRVWEEALNKFGVDRNANPPTDEKKKEVEDYVMEHMKAFREKNRIRYND